MGLVCGGTGNKPQHSGVSHSCGFLTGGIAIKSWLLRKNLRSVTSRCKLRSDTRYTQGHGHLCIKSSKTKRKGLNHSALATCNMQCSHVLSPPAFAHQRLVFISTPNVILFVASRRHYRLVKKTALLSLPPTALWPDKKR